MRCTGMYCYAYTGSYIVYINIGLVICTMPCTKNVCLSCHVHGRWARCLLKLSEVTSARTVFVHRGPMDSKAAWPWAAGCCCSHGSDGPMCLTGQRHSGKTHQAAYDDQDGGSLFVQRQWHNGVSPGGRHFPVRFARLFPVRPDDGVRGSMNCHCVIRMYVLVQNYDRTAQK